MKKWMSMTIVGLALAAALPAQARNVKYMLPIQNALESQGKLDASVKLYFGPQTYGSGQSIANIDTHAQKEIENRADIASCNAAFVEALRTLQQNAKDAGANAVANIASFFKRGSVVSSTTVFECHAGSHKTHVMLKGDLVQINSQ